MKKKSPTPPPQEAKQRRKELGMPPTARAATPGDLAAKARPLQVEISGPGFLTALATAFETSPTREDVAGVLREVLDSRQAPPGFRLPSIRQIQQLSGLPKRAVCQALKTLEQEGRIEQRQGSGTYVQDRDSANGQARPAAASPSLLMADSAGRFRGTMTGHGPAGLSNDPASPPAGKRIGVVPPLASRFPPHSMDDFLNGISQQAGLNHQVQILPAPLAEQDPVGFVDHVVSIGLDGILWLRPPPTPPLALMGLVCLRVPVVLMGRPYPSLPLKGVCLNPTDIAETLVKFIVEKGKRKLLCMVGAGDDHYTATLVAALRHSLEQRGRTLPDDQLITVRANNIDALYSIDVKEATLRFLKSHRDFDAVFTLYPNQLETLAQLHESGFRRCPEDFIHIHLGTLNLGENQRWPPFPTVFLAGPREEQGRQAVKELEQLMGFEGDTTPEDLTPYLCHPFGG